ncbi:MAG: hypothetical protein JWP18_938 [Solirubrobacterales bacterium]|jgi:hypothetical protein|nr:hypothetical protein [Solirubrobacterales bacterium]
MNRMALEEAALAWVNEVRRTAGWAALDALPPGVPCEPCDCPIGRAVGGGVEHDGRVLLWATGERLELPPRVLAFLEAFDVGAFPELEVAAAP